MGYAQEGYVQSWGSDYLVLAQLETIFYSLFAIELIGFAVAVGENVVKSLLNPRSSETVKISSLTTGSRSSETLGNSSIFLEMKHPVLCHRCSN